MTKKKRAFITGITGQDGSYLSEFLLAKEYEVGGLIRRNAVNDLGNIKHLKDELKLYHGDLQSAESIALALYDFKPDEIYNLAAQSSPLASFHDKIGTMMVTGIGAVQVFERAKIVVPDAKIYQASTSELFGAPTEVPQTEKTQIAPANPYAAAKAYAHWMAHISRADKNNPQFISCGILFNHECIVSQTPIIVRSSNKLIDIVAIEELVPHREDPSKGKKYTTLLSKPFEIWDGDHWTKVKTTTATWNNAKTKDDKKVIAITTRGGYYEATSNHVSFLEGEKEILTATIKKGDHLELKSFPDISDKISLTLEEAEFMGMMVADGYIDITGKGRFINNNRNLRIKAAMLWEKISGGISRESNHSSGFNPDRTVGSVEFSGNSNYLRYLWTEIYNQKLFKKVPKRILNSDKKTMEFFLRGYNFCDGLKAGHQKTEFKSFTTNSQSLALGLWYLANYALGCRVTLHPERRNGEIYFHLNINSDNKTAKGKHLAKSLNEVKLSEKLEYNGWLFDLETESGTFSAGIGLTWVHNSPRRGLNFVTRKITAAVACIKNNKKDGIPMNEVGEPIVQNGKLKLGYLGSERDWGYSPDYVEVIWLMLQQDQPDDFVISTGQVHTVEDFAREAFGAVGLNYKDYVETDPAFIPPVYTGPLVGDSAKARKVLGWKPKTEFKKLVEIMVHSDLAKFS